MKPFIIAIEGGEGVGKTTLINQLQQELPELIVLKEPGGTPEGEAIRDYLKANFGSLSPKEELELFAKSRSFLYDELSKAEYSDRIIVLDRSIISSMAYQAEPCGMNYQGILEENKRVNPRIELPDLVIHLDLDPEYALKRLIENGRELDENDKKPLSYHKQLRERFFELSDLIKKEGKAWWTVNALDYSVKKLIKKIIKEKEAH